MWYLQRNRQGQTFWDDFIHPDCLLVMSQNYNPFGNDNDHERKSQAALEYYQNAS